MRILSLAASVALLSSACGKPPTPEELAEQTSTDVDNFWQEAVATARITNTMTVRDELFTTLEGLQRYPSSSRPVLPDSSTTSDAFADFKVLAKRVFSQANLLESGGTTARFRISGNDVCTPLRGNFNVDTTCVKNVDSLKMAIRAVGGTAGVDLTFLVNDTIEVGTVQILKGVSVSATVDLANARAASEFFNSSLGMESPFRSVTFDGTGKVEVKLKKFGPSDFEASVSFLTALTGSITDNQGFTRSGASAARSPVFALRIEGPAKSVTTTVDVGASEFRGLWSDFFDDKLKSPMFWALSGVGVKAAVKDGGARTATIWVGGGGNTLSFGNDQVVSFTLNPNAQNRFDLDFSTGSSGLSAVTVRPGILAALAFNLQPVAAAGSMSIDPAILNATYSYDLASSDNAPKLELTKPTMMLDASWRLTNGKLTLSGSGTPRVFTGPQCVAFRQSSLSTGMNPLLDFWMKCEECTAGQCGGLSPQSTSCKKYVSCYEATGGTFGSLASTYGTNGTCWTNTAATANACTEACISALSALRSAHPNATACF